MGCSFACSNGNIVLYTDCILFTPLHYCCTIRAHEGHICKDCITMSDIIAENRQ